MNLELGPNDFGNIILCYLWTCFQMNLQSAELAAYTGSASHAPETI